MKSATFMIAAGVAAVGYLSLTTMGDITGTDHDFSGSSWAEGQICLPCHAPHNALAPETGALWNHSVTTASYQVYGGDGSFLPTTEALDHRSILCMSCHDGTVAVDAFGGEAGTFFMFGSHNLGTDLRNDHPVGLSGEYPSHSGFKNPSTWEGVAGFGMRLYEMDIDGTPTPVVSCATCHDVHNSNNNDDFLWIDNSGSALCLTCHNK